MSKELKVGDILRENGDGPNRIYDHANPGAQFRDETGVVWELDLFRDWVVIDGDWDGSAPAELTVLSLGV